MTKSPWYRWPENKTNGLVPWWTILRRAIFWPLLYAGVCITFVAISCGHGLSEATRFWRTF